MKYILGIILVLVLIGWSCGGGSNGEKVEPIVTTQDSVSYSIGMDIGSTFNKQSIEVNQSLFFQGFKDVYGGDSARLTQDEMQKVLVAFQQQQRTQRQERAQQLAQENKEKGDVYLKSHAQEPGVVVLPSGLQYRVLEPGSGPTPTINDRVSVHYKGTLLDGTVFDSSYDRGQPANFAVGRVIKGWTEALQLMKVGAKWELTIPPELAYGERGAGEKIEPNSVLIFEVELLGIENPEALPQNSGK